ICLGSYYFYFKTAVPGGAGTLPTQEISITGVEMDLNAIAQAERAYDAQNGTYATLDQLTSSGTLTMTRTSRDGYTYSVEVTPTGFSAIATWKPSAPEQVRLHYPTISVDQTMQMHRGQ
ncbi:MAG: hypothetical protein ACRD5L_06890, partial [Bryobacteraceae bacterium]